VSRPPLSKERVERIRRERFAPRPTQWDYLHLAGLHRALTFAFARIGVARGPILDLYCGSKPYLDLIPWRPVLGLDLDRHFGGADVVGTIPLPFRARAFRMVLCTQALHLVDDPPATVKEMYRVLAPGGYAVVTIPHLFRREIPAERKWSRKDVRELFADWDEVRVSGIDGLGSGLIYFPASLVGAAARRWRLVRWLLPPFALALNAAGAVLERALRPLAQRWPASLILMARRPDS
jgi:SAM-dependent methyltransferase